VGEAAVNLSGPQLIRGPARQGAGPFSVSELADALAIDLRDGERSGRTHRAGELRADELKSSRDALIAECSKAPHVRATEAHGPRTQCECLENIGATAEAAVDQHGNAAVDRCDDLGQHFESAYAGVECATAVVRDDDSIGACFRSENSIFGRKNSLDHEFAIR